MRPAFLPRYFSPRAQCTQELVFKNEVKRIVYKTWEAAVDVTHYHWIRQVSQGLPWNITFFRNSLAIFCLPIFTHTNHSKQHQLSINWRKQNFPLISILQNGLSKNVFLVTQKLSVIWNRNQNMELFPQICLQKMKIDFSFQGKVVCIAFLHWH